MSASEHGSGRHPTMRFVSTPKCAIRPITGITFSRSSNHPLASITMPLLRSCLTRQRPMNHLSGVRPLTTNGPACIPTRLPLVRAGGGSRTHTSYRIQVPKTCASAIPPLRRTVGIACIPAMFLHPDARPRPTSGTAKAWKRRRAEPEAWLPGGPRRP